MRSIRRWGLRCFGAAAALSVIAGCGGPSEPTRYYVLSTPADVAAQKAATVKGQRLSIGIGPIQLPAHLDRGQIVTQASRNRLAVNELDQWGEPLKEGVSLVLVRNLSALLATDRVFKYPWRRPVVVDYQVTVQVLQYDTDADGKSTLNAHWNIIKGDGRELLYSQTSAFSSQVVGEGIEPIVAAMSDNLAQFSREIATSIAAFRK